MELHDYFENSGPIWKGSLWDEQLVSEMYKSLNENNKMIISKPLNKKLKIKKNNLNLNKKLIKFLGIVKGECKIDTIGFYDLHKIVKKYKIKNIPRKLELIKKLKKLGYKACETHFSGTGVRSDIGFKELIKIVR